MFWWILTGVLVLAVALLVATLVSLAGRVRPLQRAVHRMAVRAEQAQGLHSRIDQLQHTVQELAAVAESTAARASGMKGQPTHTKSS